MTFTFREKKEIINVNIYRYSRVHEHHRFTLDFKVSALQAALAHRNRECLHELNHKPLPRDATAPGQVVFGSYYHASVILRMTGNINVSQAIVGRFLIALFFCRLNNL